MVEATWIDFPPAPAEPVDGEATQALCIALMQEIVAHYRSRPITRSTACEVLNALAGTVAIILAGTQNDAEARAFFDAALEQNLADLLANPPNASSPAVIQGEQAMTVQAHATLAPARRRVANPTGELDELEQSKFWERVRTRLRGSVAAESYDAFLARLALVSIDGELARLSVPTSFLKNWVERHYRDNIIAALKAEREGIRAIELTVRSALRPAANPLREAAPAASEARPAPPTVTEALSPPVDQLRSALHPRFTFAHFLSDGSNRTALAAALDVAAATHCGAAPTCGGALFISGRLGAGKTHLLQAIAHEAGPRAAYVSAERFQFFWRRERPALPPEISTVLFDDIHFLFARGGTHFAWTLGELFERGCRVVLSADRMPPDLGELDQRLHARLTGGLAVQIADPEESLREQMLARRIQEAQAAHPRFAVPEESAGLIVAGTRNGREIEGCINRLLMHHIANPDGAAVTAADIQAILATLFGRRDEPVRVTIRGIQEAVAREFGLTRSDLMSSRRTAVVVWPRQVAMYLAKVMTLKSLPEIGRQFGGRDHTTVLHAVNKISRLLREAEAVPAANGIHNNNKNIVPQIERLRARIVKDAERAAAAVAF